MDAVYSIAFTPNGNGVVSGSLDQTLKHWDIRPALHARAMAGLAGKPDRGAKDGCDGGRKGIWDARKFTGHKDYVLTTAVSSDGRFIVSGSKDRSVQLWDANTAIPQFMLQGHTNSGVFALTLCHLRAQSLSPWPIVLSDLSRYQRRWRSSCHGRWGLPSPNLSVPSLTDCNFDVAANTCLFREIPGGLNGIRRTRAPPVHRCSFVTYACSILLFSIRYCNMIHLAELSAGLLCSHSSQTKPNATSPAQVGSHCHEIVYLGRLNTKYRL